MMEERKLFRRNDLIILGIIVLLCIAMIIPKLFNNDKLTAYIYVNGKVEYEIKLNDVDESYFITPDSNPETQICVENGRICFSHAECKDKLCVNSGWLNSNGQTAACLPARVVINIKGTDNSVDMMTY